MTLPSKRPIGIGPKSLESTESFLLSPSSQKWPFLMRKSDSWYVMVSPGSAEELKDQGPFLTAGIFSHF